MPAQRKRITTPGVQLRRPPETHQRLVMFLLEGEAVPGCYPCDG